MARRRHRSSRLKSGRSVASKRISLKQKMPRLLRMPKSLRHLANLPKSPSKMRLRNPRSLEVLKKTAKASAIVSKKMRLPKSNLKKLLRRLRMRRQLSQLKRKILSWKLNPPLLKKLNK